MWTSRTCFAKRDAVIMATLRGMACAPSAGGRNTSKCGRNRSRMTGLWQRSKPVCISADTFTSLLLVCCATVWRVHAFYCDTCTASLSVYPGLKAICHVCQAAARGGSSLCHHPGHAVPVPGRSIPNTPGSPISGTLLQI